MAEATVTVLCRLPHGVRLRLAPQDETERRARMSKEDRPDRSPTRIEREVLVNGANKAPNYHPKDNVMLGRVGRTTVDKVFWDAWLAQHKDSDLVKNHCVFAELSERNVESRVREFEAEKTGYEPVDPDELKRKGLEVAA